MLTDQRVRVEYFAILKLFMDNCPKSDIEIN